jgi:glycosyltransferase involved in cell wall biosynthesis
MVLLEAGASGIPAIATDVEGTREVVVNGQTGWLTPAGNSNALAEAMTKLMQDPLNERRAMGERARQHVSERFNLSKILSDWELLYTDLLERNRAQPGIRLTAWESFKRRSAPSA